MLRIEIEGHDAAHIRAQLQDLLRLYPSEMVQKFTFDTEQKFVLQPGGDVIEVAKPVTQPIMDESGSQVGEVFVAAADTPGLTAIRQEIAAAPRGRGRPRKNQTPAEASASAPQPAVGDNTGSAPAGLETSPAEGVKAPGADTVATPSAPAPTAAQMRASLQALIEAAPDTDTGQSKAREILAAFEVRKVGEVKPEQFAPIIVKAAEAMAAFKEGAQ